MKLLTLNFLTCARKACKASPAAFPLHPRHAELEMIEGDYNIVFMKNVLGRLDWGGLGVVVREVSLPTTSLPTAGEEGAMEIDPESADLKGLHSLLIETSMNSGELVCGNCGQVYPVKEGIANFLLPSHLV
ncbi:Trm112p-domain-containing protein [Piedraia hortae CBS 480.64]|uniref:Trm112p-domain-containing protein n=1 Tax=Piedraia hortae CBS 480.64 TaxID=1314780 RepID=A0A6A7C8V9_9PEZI|nr:Trm112p-domain-containing protein [Piedraia hortae CBS 480.64]